MIVKQRLSIHIPSPVGICIGWIVAWAAIHNGHSNNLPWIITGVLPIQFIPIVVFECHWLAFHFVAFPEKATRVLCWLKQHPNEHNSKQVSQIETNKGWALIPIWQLSLHYKFTPIFKAEEPCGSMCHSPTTPVVLIVGIRNRSNIPACSLYKPHPCLYYHTTSIIQKVLMNKYNVPNLSQSGTIPTSGEK